MTKKLPPPDKRPPLALDVARQDEEDITDYVQRMCSIIFQPTYKEKQEIQRKREQRAAEEAAFQARKKKLRKTG